MDTAFWIISGIVACLAMVAGWVFARKFRRWRESCRAHDLAQAKQRFHRRREWLEARFMTLASQSGKPRGLSWAECDFEDAVHFARDRQSGRFRALVGMTIRFEAVIGGDLEDNPNVKNLRAATAVFRMERNEWMTDGIAVFNLSPAQTIRHYRHELEELPVLAPSLSERGK